MQTLRDRQDDYTPRKRNCFDSDGQLVEDDGFITLYPPMAKAANSQRVK